MDHYFYVWRKVSIYFIYIIKNTLLIINCESYTTHVLGGPYYMNIPNERSARQVNVVCLYQSNKKYSLYFLTFHFKTNEPRAVARLCLVNVVCLYQLNKKYSLFFLTFYFKTTDQVRWWQEYVLEIFISSHLFIYLCWEIFFSLCLFIYLWFLTQFLLIMLIITSVS